MSAAPSRLAVVTSVQYVPLSNFEAERRDNFVGFSVRRNRFSWMILVRCCALISAGSPAMMIEIFRGFHHVTSRILTQLSHDGLFANNLSFLIHLPPDAMHSPQWNTRRSCTPFVTAHPPVGRFTTLIGRTSSQRKATPHSRGSHSSICDIWDVMP